MLPDKIYLCSLCGKFGKDIDAWHGVCALNFKSPLGGHSFAEYQKTPTVPSEQTKAANEYLSKTKNE